MPTTERCTLLLLACLASAANATANDMTMAEAAQKFLGTLGAEERAKASMPFDADERYNWHFTAKLREGLPLKKMSPAQREAATLLLRTAVSQQGFEKAELVRRIEEVLREIEGGSARRDPEMYYFSVFGEPKDSGAWGFRYEGHHVSLNFTVVNGRVVATTPQFFGSNPAEVKAGPLKGTRLLGREEDLARGLLDSLTAEQKALAVTSETAPPEILTAASRTASLQEDVGIPYGKLDKAQQAQLVALIEEHAVAQRPEQARQRLDAVRAAGLDKVKFVWMGSAARGQGHYYRVQGPTFIIEYDNTQTGANHAHTVWRDFAGDWGADVLAEHYRTSPHHAAPKQ